MVMPPCLRVSPLEFSEGTNPRKAMNSPRHIRPLALGSGGAPKRSIKAISSNILQSARWDVLSDFKEKTYNRKGFGFSLEEFVVGSVGDHGGLSVLPNAYLFQRKRWAGDVLREGLSCLGGSGWNVHRSVDTESRVPPIDQAGGDLGTD